MYSPPAWFKLVHKKVQGPGPTRRFSVSLNESDYERLRKLAEERRPALSLQYVTEYAVQMLLKSADDPGFAQAMGNPLAGIPKVQRRRR